MEFCWAGSYMVIRSLLLLILFIPIANALTLRDAANAYKKRQYRKSIKIIKRISKGNIKFYTDDSLILMSKNFEQLGEMKNANMIRNFMISRKYRKENREVKKALAGKIDLDDLDELPKGLLKVYYMMLSSRYDMYLKNKSARNKKAVIKFAELLVEQDYKSDKAEIILKRFRDEEQRKKDAIFYKKYFMLASYASWQDEIILTDDSSGFEQDINSTAQGTLLTAGMTYGNAHGEYRFQLSVGFGAATVGEDSGDFDYFQNNVGETLFSFTSGYLWKTSDNVSIGVSAPLLLRIGDFTEPDGFTISQGTIITTGLLAHMVWNINSYFLNLEFGKVLKLRSSFINIGVGYTF